MEGTEIAALIAAIAFAVLVVALAVPILRLRHTVDAATRAMRDVADQTGPLLTLGVMAHSRKENEHRLPIHPAHIERIDPELRAQIFVEQGYGARFGVTDEMLARQLGGVRSRADLIAAGGRATAIGSTCSTRPAMVSSCRPAATAPTRRQRSASTHRCASTTARPTPTSPASRSVRASEPRQVSRSRRPPRPR